MSEPLMPDSTPDYMDYTIDELMAVCIARQITDGEIVAQGIATPLVVAGYILAKCTHAPNLRFVSAIGQGICETWSALGVARIEELWLGRALMSVGFASASAEVLPRLHPREFFRPAQVDAAGNFNNIAFGKDYHHPRMRLPGVGGIPDVTTSGDRVSLYVPRHSRLTFVERCDFVSGLGHTPDRLRGRGPQYLISDLGQFDWADGHIRLTTYHATTTLDHIRAKTGCALSIADAVQPTPAPSAEEVRLLREEIDPMGVRKLEILGGAARRDLLREILAKEGVL